MVNGRVYDTANNTNISVTQLPTLLPVPEPGPDWPTARLVWGIAWKFHWAGFGACFSLLALLSMAAMISEGKIKSFARKRLFYAVNTLVITLGVTRAIYLLIDPYESAENNIIIPKWLVRPLFGIAFPCLTSAFCLLHIAFLEVTKIRVAPGKIQNLWFVSSIIVFHFVLVLVSDTTVALKPDQSELLIVCQSFFIAWGFLNSACFIYSGSRIIFISKRLKKTTSNEAAGSRARNRGSTTKVAKVTMATSILGLSCSALQVYSLVGVYGAYSKVVDPQPWPWWAFQTGFRLVEFAMGATLLYSVVQSAAAKKNRVAWFCCRQCVVNKSVVDPQDIQLERKCTVDTVEDNL